MEVDKRIEASKANLNKIYVKYREKLGDTKLVALIDELQAVYAESIRKEAGLPDDDGSLDANSLQKKDIAKERDLKIVLIKQKYGI